MRAATTGVATREAWRRNSRLHVKTAVIRRAAGTGEVTWEEWWREGKLHRGPAVIEHNVATGAATSEEWWLNDGPRQEPPKRETAPAPAAPGLSVYKIYYQMFLQGLT